MATIKARLQNIYRDLGRAGKRWENTVKVFGGAYSEALNKHTLNLPTKKPPDTTTILMAKTAAGVVTLAAGTVLSPLTVVVIFTGVSMAIEEVGNKLGEKGKPLRTIPPITPLNYQNKLSTYISGYITDCQDLIDKFIEAIDKIKDPVAEYGSLTNKDMDKVEKWIASSPFTYPPFNPESWNNGKALEKEMEKFLWMSWAKQMKMNNAKKMIAASKGGDMTKPYNRLAELGALRKTNTNYSDSGFKVHLQLLMNIIGWANSYKPKRFGSPAPKAAQQFALKASGLQNMKKPNALRLELRKLLLSIEKI